MVLWTLASRRSWQMSYVTRNVLRTTFVIGGTLLDPYARVSHRVLLHRLSFSAQARHDARALGRVDLVPVEPVEEQDAQLGIRRARVGLPKVRKHECFGEVEHFAHHAHAVAT